MKSLKKITGVLMCFFCIKNTNAQELHFSQFFNSPLITNPANTGFIPDADYRLSAQYRNQWSSIMAVPYKTMSMSGDVQLLRGKLENGWIGAGLVLENDVAGSGSLRTSRIYGSIAYHKMLGLSSLLSAGFNLGWATKSINPSSLKFPDQFDGKFFDGARPTAGVPLNNTVDYYDLQVGMNYAYFPQENTYINAGYSIHHVNSPRETFFKDQSVNGIISLRHTAFVNAILKLHDNVIVNPNAYVSMQDGAMDLSVGSLFYYNLSDAGEKQFITGLYYRLNDAVIPMLGFEVNSLRFTFSFDATISTLRNYNSYRGASEFSLVKKGFYSNNSGRQSMCPRF
jgi:type IX secretion system PorP/SprF family membrane protein